MSKMILLVEPDASLRGELTRALAGVGYEVQPNPDGQDVIEQVRTEQPDAIILCVELPKGSGYAICSKLRKDEQLKRIPLLLTSAVASQIDFDKHKALKFGRADEYLRKPFTPADLVERVRGLLGDTDHGVADDSLGLSDLAAEFGDPLEERISVDEIEEIAVDDDLAPTSSSLPGEQDVDMLESAFEKLEDRDQTGIHHALNGAGDTDLLTGDEPLFPSADQHEDSGSRQPVGRGADDGEPLLSARSQHESASLRSSISGSELMPTASPSSRLGSTGGEVHSPEPASRAAQNVSAVQTGGTSRDKEYFQLKDKLAQREKDMLRLREDLTSKEKELLELRDHETQVERDSASKDDELGKRDAQIRQLQQKVESVVAGQRRTDKDLNTAREEARVATQKEQAAEGARGEAEVQALERHQAVERLEEELAAARQQLEELETETTKQQSRNDDIEAELTGVRAQLDDANGSIDDLRRQLDQQREEYASIQENLRQRLSDLEDEKRENEGRIVKAYQRLKGEDLVREKAKKALHIALELLGDQGADSEEAEQLT